MPEHPDNLRYHLGPGLEVGNAYPMLHARGFYEGMRAEGEQEILLLCRSAWAGSQRYGALVWSGDIDSTFEDLRRQIPAGLNIGLSGIPWWTTDIGGFKGGDITSPSFRELIVRWFQFGVFCPVFRLHGIRQPGTMVGSEQTGAANEVWSFGETEYEILRHLLFLRERLRPYVMEQMRVAHSTGLPPMRPLFLDFPADPACWEIAGPVPVRRRHPGRPGGHRGRPGAGGVPAGRRGLAGRLDRRAGRRRPVGHRGGPARAHPGVRPRPRRAVRPARLHRPPGALGG